LGRSGEGDAGGDAGDHDKSKEGLNEFHQDLDFGFGSSWGTLGSAESNSVG
jgi:hypothetical protein